MTTKTTIKPSVDQAAAKRLNAFIRAHIHKTNRQAAIVLDENESGLWKMINGHSKINMVLIKKLVKDYKLNVEWLQTGKGSDVLKESPQKTIITDFNQLSADMNTLEKQLKIVNLTVEHLMKRIEQQDREIAELKAVISKK